MDADSIREWMDTFTLSTSEERRSMCRKAVADGDVLNESLKKATGSLVSTDGTGPNSALEDLVVFAGVALLAKYKDLQVDMYFTLLAEVATKAYRRERPDDGDGGIHDLMSRSRDRIVTLIGR